MALSEADIRRYSRQILLRGVGGHGQGRLLATPASAIGAGTALGHALAYLEAGGTPRNDESPGGGLVAAPARPSGRAPCVVLGSRDGDAVLLWRDAAGCARCFETAAVRLGAPPEGPAAVALGAAAALAWQRLVLGRAEALGARRLPAGEASKAVWCGEEIDGCPEHSTPSLR